MDGDTLYYARHAVAADEEGETGGLLVGGSTGARDRLTRPHVAPTPTAPPAPSIAGAASSTPAALVASPCGRWAAVLPAAAAGGGALLFDRDRTRGGPVMVLDARSAPLGPAAWAPRGSAFVAAASGGADGFHVATGLGGDGPPPAVHVRPGGRWPDGGATLTGIALGSDGALLALYTDGRLLAAFPPYDAPEVVLEAEVGAEGRFLRPGGARGALRAGGGLRPFLIPTAFTPCSSPPSRTRGARRLPWQPPPTAVPWSWPALALPLRGCD